MSQIDFLFQIINRFSLKKFQKRDRSVPQIKLPMIKLIHILTICVINNSCSKN
jgi:hypothetical protein